MGTERSPSAEEELCERRIGLGLERSGVGFPRACGLLEYKPHVRRFVGLAAVGDRREVRRVGLDEQTPGRHRQHRLADVLPLRERHHPGNADEQAAPAHLLDPRRALRERVRDAAHPGRSIERAEEVLPRLAVVQHDRQAALARQAELPREYAPLVLPRGEVVVVVETDFPDRDDPRRLKQRLQPPLPGSVAAARLVRVETEGAHDPPLPSPRHLGDRVEILAAGGGNEDHRHAGAVGTCEHLVPDGGLEHRQVRMRIDHESSPAAV